MSVLYKAQAHFKPEGLLGISQKQIDEHWKLYEGYCAQSNTLIAQLNDMREGGEGASPLYADRRRRLAFEMCGMIVHDYYFSSLEAGHTHSECPDFVKSVTEKFGSFDNWVADFKACAATRGVGHAMCYMDPITGDINNHFVELHNDGHMPGFHVLLSCDVWEHAFLLDYLPSERGTYIQAFLDNTHWERVEARFANAKGQKASLRYNV